MQAVVTGCGHNTCHLLGLRLTPWVPTAWTCPPDPPGRGPYTRDSTDNTHCGRGTSSTDLGVPWHWTPGRGPCTTSPADPWVLAPDLPCRLWSLLVRSVCRHNAFHPLRGNVASCPQAPGSPPPWNCPWDPPGRGPCTSQCPHHTAPPL